MQVITTEVVEGLRSAVTNRTDLIANPMNIVGVGMDLMNKYPTLSGTEKKALLVKALHSLASGADGILGTADDTIPKPIVDTITQLLQGNLIENVIGLVADVTKGRFDSKKAVAVAVEAKGLFTGCMGMGFIKSFLQKRQQRAKTNAPAKPLLRVKSAVQK